MISSTLINMIKLLQLIVEQMDLDVDNHGMLLLKEIQFQLALQLSAKPKLQKLNNPLKIEEISIKKTLKIQVRKLK